MQKTTPFLESIQISYLGRIPSRVDGIKRRAVILDAVRSIIITSGVQGVKHRAIAELANVPLAATTYYFADIHALLHDAFLDFCEKIILDLQRFESAGLDIISSFDSAEKLNQNDFKQLQLTMANIVFQHIIGQVKNNSDRIIESAFRNESLRNPDLAKVVNAMELQQVNAISQFFKLLGSDDPDSDSRGLIAAILYLEHGLLAGYVTEDQAKNTINRLLNQMFG